MSVLLPMCIFPLTFWLQLELGYEVSLFPLYMLPVAVVSWAFGVCGIILSVTLATGLWYWGAMIVGHEYQHEWTTYYNAGVRGLVFLMVGVFILIFRRVVEQHRNRMETMRSLMNVCHACGSVQGSDGRWIPFEALDTLKVSPVCECPECQRVQNNRGVKGERGRPKPESTKPKACVVELKPESGDVKPEGTELQGEEERPWRPGDPDRRKHQRRAEDR